MATRIYRIITISDPASKCSMKLKLRPNSSPSGPAATDIASAIRARFQLSASTNLALKNEKDEEVPIDSSLQSGHYTLQIVQEQQQTLKRSALSASSLKVKTSSGGRAIAVFIDGSRYGRAALHSATEFVRGNDRLFIVHCLDHIHPEKGLDPTTHTQISQLRCTHARELLSDASGDARAALHDSKINIETVVLESSSRDDYRERAINFLNDHEFDAVFVGTQGTTHGSHLVGSFSKYLARRATAPVFVIKNTSRAGRHLLVFVDKHEHCKSAFRVAIRRKKPKDKLIIVNVVDNDTHKVVEGGREVLAKFADHCKKKEIGNVETKLLVSDHDVRETAASYANQADADMIFLGTRGLDEPLLLTSFSSYMTKNSHSDVIVVRDPTLTLGTVYHD